MSKQVRIDAAVLSADGQTLTVDATLPGGVLRNEQVPAILDQRTLAAYLIRLPRSRAVPGLTGIVTFEDAEYNQFAAAAAAEAATEAAIPTHNDTPSDTPTDTSVATDAAAAAVVTETVAAAPTPKKGK